MTLTNSFYESSIILTPKPDKDAKREETYKPMSLMYIDANINNILANQVQQHFKRIIHHDQVRFIQEIPYKNPSNIFHRNWKTILKFIWNYKRIWRAKTILKKKGEAGDITLPDFELYYKENCHNQNRMVLA